MDEEHDQPVAHGDQQGGEQGQVEEQEEQLEPEAGAHSLKISLSVELGGEYVRSLDASDDADIEHEKELVDDGDARHGLGADLAYHQVVDEAYEVGYDVLYEHGEHYDQDAPVECSRAYQLGHYYLPGVMTAIMTAVLGASLILTLHSQLARAMQVSPALRGSFSAPQIASALPLAT